MNLKLKNRYLPIASALAITGLVVSQIPTPSSISSAANSVSLVANAYPEGDSNNNTAPLVVGGLGVISSIAGGAGGAAAGGAGGASGGVIPPGGGGASMTVTLQSILEVSDFYAIYQMAGLDFEVIYNGGGGVALGMAGVTTQHVGTKELQAKGYTLLAPTNDSLIKALGAEKVALMKQPAGKALAKAFVSGLIIPRRFNFSELKDAGSLSKSLLSVGGDSISLKVDGGKLMANTAEVLATEYAAKNGSILVTNGVVNGN